MNLIDFQEKDLEDRSKVFYDGVIKLINGSLSERNSWTVSSRLALIYKMKIKLQCAELDLAGLLDTTYKNAYRKF